MSIACLISAMAGLLAYVLVGSSGAPVTAAALAGIAAFAAAARIFLAMPTAIQALSDLRP
ncbi:hypothetical protein [Streptomyces sp. 135]|uniref:hypothetical protein n=1 Tax=Streptomyces sp. 135 TaxID=2838850 RepID=UPI001CBCFE60|nr:hypothetical protein [Streptomyces sp. 135]